MSKFVTADMIKPQTSEELADNKLRRDSRFFALKRLPSHNLDISKFDQMTPKRKFKMTTVESYKMKRGSSLVRQISRKDVPELAKMLEYLDKQKSKLSSLKTLKEMNVSIAVKREIKKKFFALREAEESQHRDYKKRILKVYIFLKNFFNFLFYYLDLWDFKIKVIHGHFGFETASFFISLRWLLRLNIFNFLVVLFCVAIPQLVFEKNWSIYPIHSPFSISDIITGGGWFENSLLYYGRYTNETSSKYINYSRPKSYLLTVVVLFLTNFVIVTRSLAIAYRTCYYGAKMKVEFCHKVFCSWDFAMVNKKAVDLRLKCTCQELLELLCSSQEGQKKNRKTRMIEILFGTFLNVFILTLICALAYFVFSVQSIFKDRSSSDLFAPVVMALITAGFYIWLKQLTKLEYFLSKENQFYMTIVRVAIMRNVIVAFLVYFWIQQRDSYPTLECYENYHGMEIYQLIVINFIFMSGLYMLVLFLCKLASMYWPWFASTFPPLPFDTAFQINDMIFYQTLIWIGFFLGPMLSALFIVIAALNFYGWYYTIKFCSPMDKTVWLPSFFHLLFVLITFFCLLLSMMRVGYIWMTAIPSENCGPFRGQKTLHTILKEWIDKGIEDNSILVTLMEKIQSPISIFSLMLILFVVTYFQRSFCLVEQEMEDYLKEDIVVVGKDKGFLLTLYEESLYEDLKQGEVTSTLPNQKHKKTEIK